MSKRTVFDSTHQAVILAAGKSSRCWPLNSKHKSLFQVGGKPLICHTIENLVKARVKRIVIVQGKGKDIQNEVEKCKFSSKPEIKYVLQTVPRGTGDALKAAKNYLGEKFLVLYGDDFYGLADLKNCLSRFPSILVKEVENPASFGVIIKEGNHVKGIIEKPKNPPSNLVNAGGFFIPKTILNEKLDKSKRGEYEVTDYINRLAEKTKVYFSKSKEWVPLPFSWNLLDINQFLLKKSKSKIQGKVEKNCQIKGTVIIGKGTVVKSGTYIEGPVYIDENCQIGPNCFLRPFTFISKNCFIGHSVEIKNSIVSQGSRIAHLNYLGDSIVGQNCNFGSGTVVANLRLDGKAIKSKINGKIINTGKEKLGAVLGDNVNIGVNCSLMPGILVGPNSVIGPHSLIRENVKENEISYSKMEKVIKKRNAI